MATVHQERESQFDTLLVKIDTIMKEVVYATPAFDFADFHELENEAAFIEKELKELAEIFAHLQQQEEETRRYLKNQLNGIQDHLNQFDLSYMPLRLKQRFDLIHQHVNTFLDQLQKF
jgi:hypothetical protein